MYTVHRLRVSRFGFINYSYLILDQATLATAIVDPAWDQRQVLETIRSLNGELRVILLTHSHFDHVNLVRFLVKRFAPQVWIGRDEANFYGFNCPGLNLLDHLTELKLGETTIRALLTPGHTAGGVCYLLDRDLFTGDTLFVEGCGICDCGGGSPEQMYHSLALIRRSAPSHARVHPGHSFGKEPGQTMADLVRNNIYFNFDNLRDFVAFRMRSNQKAPLEFR